MTATTTATPSSTTTTTTHARSLWLTGLVAGLAAGAATTLVVLAADAVGVDVATTDGEQIPLLGFAQMTLVGALIGVLLSTVCRRRSSRPRHAFVVTTVVLTAFSFVPDVLFDGDVSTKLLLMSTHLVAAAIIIPALAKRLPVDRHA